MPQSFRHAARVTAARQGDFDRPLYPYLERVARAVVRDASRQTTQPRADIAHDTTASGRADAAYKHELGKREGLIEAASRDRSLSPDQRFLVVRSLREQQRTAAHGARQSILDDERSAARAARRRARPRTPRKPPR